MENVTTTELRNTIALKDLPEEALQWLLDHSKYEEFEDGTVIGKYGDPAEWMWFILEGSADFYMNINGRLVYYFTFENNPQTGGVGGLIPYSRMKTLPGNSYAIGRVRVISLHKNYFHELEQLNPEFIQQLIGYMTERARAFATTQLQHEKVNALGKLAAGIAHELNNPAAAINSISNELYKRLGRNYELTENLLHSNMQPELIHTIRAIVLKKEAESGQKSKLTVLQKMDAEDTLADWLENSKITDNRALAETFTEFGFSIEELENICSMAGDSFKIVLPWLENLLISQKNLTDLDDASNRISSLVGAIKSHVHMDRMGDLQSTNIHVDIENTLTLLGHKLREKNITVKKLFYEKMPLIPAYVSELNQVWTNIIDNAVFALEKNGILTIESCLEDDEVSVNIIDNGPGIPKEIMSRIFDPFFTTKKVGEGTGIGLDLVNRAIKHHRGKIKVTSEPGNTEFSVFLPLIQKE